VLFPAFSRVAREDPQRMKSVYYRARLRLDALAMPAIGIVLIAGPWLISLLYRPEYFDAGWMLQLLSIKAAMYCMLTPCETCLFSLGHARYGFYRNLARAVWVLGGIPLGWTLGGVAGVIWAVALSEIPVLLVLWWAARRHGLLDLVMELRAPGFLGVGAMLGWALIRIVEALT
jgi:O-antigen/teichoic acid export membrane protein